ncbi:hypothetical protein CONPUDRAFT_86804 [Coniophora puteana RWD-64-598 SS2]|uniref:Mid2 domain-containing protein n=1 Tax=Coniophora puteana (strain RWD-64-598) TaxID=741705 RepID=A0A5M3N6H6_CONPW|nr:uncharacterized protein CONPUDRAFT_86804 [Coniophora puteana RWD-64-598 SS2]EIW86868.1 hypothetical protein CONPUDRAFT_86804 [Coniophora puteana RWD-64-598 SS2]
MRTKLKPTLLLYVSLILACVAIVDANSFDTHRRDHRLIKMRAPAEFARGLLGLGDNNPTSSSSADSASASPSSSASATDSAASSSASSSVASASGSQSLTGTSSAASTTGSTGPLGSLVDGLLPTVSSASTTASSTSASTTSTASSTPQPTSAPHTSATPVQITSNSNGYVVTITSDPAAPSPTTNNDSSQGAAATITHATWISIGAVFGGIIGVAVIWTIFRKWKFRKSREFDDRMAPIDWLPPDDNSHRDSGLPGSSRRYSNASSFHSGNANEDSVHGHGGYASAQHPIPDHDFTAGAAHLAPIGGYADLARGASPQPQMHDLHRGVSMSRPMPTASPAPSYHPGYDQYGMPVHHGGY